MLSLPSRCGEAALGIAALLVVASCDISSDPHAGLAADIRATYTQFFAENDFAYVFLTYPESVDALPVAKKVEFRTVQRVLDGLAIPNESLRHDEAMVKFTGSKGKREYVGYLVREGLAARYAGRTILFINIGLGTARKGTIHPISRKHKLDVKVVTDPIDFALRS